MQLSHALRASALASPTLPPSNLFLTQQRAQEIFLREMN